MKIEIVNGPGAGRTFSFENTSEIRIGRDEQCQVRLEDPKVSRCHARITPRGDQVGIEDLDSANGIRINGVRIRDVVLAENDKLAMGDTLLTVTGLPPLRPGQRVSRMVRVADRTKTVVLSAMPQQKASILGQTTAPDQLEALRAAHRHLQVIGDITQSLAGERDTEAALHAVVGILREAVAADTACVLTRRKNETDWTVRAVRTREVPDAQMEISETIIRQSLAEGVAILCRDPILDERFQKSVSMLAEGVTSAICTPMRFGDGSTGVLFLDRRRQSEVFTEQDLRLTATVANILSLMLNRPYAPGTPSRTGQTDN